MQAQASEPINLSDEPQGTKNGYDFPCRSKAVKLDGLKPSSFCGTEIQATDGRDAVKDVPIPSAAVTVSNSTYCQLPVARRTHPSHRCSMETEKATFGAGCFWGVEETFRKLKGVTDTAVGYAGGNKDNPTYEDVCTDETGHAEVVQVEFDPAQISYRELLDVFWANHNPTTLNRQGPDVGSQYRSVILYHSPEQKAAAEESKNALAKSGRFKREIVTQIEPAPKFFRAEEYHQRYLEKRGLSHCAI
jgi:peptide-methionine (S)-S-oxide reductase